jgi:hypothetical protein
MDLWHKMDTIVNMAGMIVMISSLVSTFINQKIRAAMADKQDVDPMLLKAAALVNVFSANLDKAMQLVRVAREQKLAGASNQKIVQEVLEEAVEIVEEKKEEPTA